MTMARPTMMDGIATLAVVKAKERKMQVVEMKMFRWSHRIRRKDGIRNEGIRIIVKVGDICLWLRGQEECGWEVGKKKMKDCGNEDIKERGISENEAWERDERRRKKSRTGDLN